MMVAGKYFTHVILKLLLIELYLMRTYTNTYNVWKNTRVNDDFI